MDSSELSTQRRMELERPNPAPMEPPTGGRIVAVQGQPAGMVVIALQRSPSPQGLLPHCAIVLLRGDYAGYAHAFQHGIAPLNGRFREAIRPQTLGRLGQPHEQGCCKDNDQSHHQNDQSYQEYDQKMT